MNEGNKSRTIAATSMNAESSRSHAVFSVMMTQTQKDEATGVGNSEIIYFEANIFMRYFFICIDFHH